VCVARARVCVYQKVFVKITRRGGTRPPFFGYVKNSAGRRKKGINQSEERVVTQSF